MVDLATLPAELFDHITSDSSTNCLAACALVNKAWHARVVPLLYASIDFHFRMRHSNERCSRAVRDPTEQHPPWNFFTQTQTVPNSVPSQIQHPPLILFARTLVDSPALASLVQRFRLVGTIPQSLFHRNPTSPELSWDRDYQSVKALLIAQGYPIEDIRRWLKYLGKGYPYAYAALCLVCLHNLRHIEFGLFLHKTWTFVGMNLVKRLSLLKSVRTGAFDIFVYMNPKVGPHTWTKDISQLLLFNLPHLRHLALNIPSLPENWTWPGSTPCAEHIYSLELAYTFVGPGDLTRLLEVCPRIRTLKYDLWPRDDRIRDVDATTKVFTDVPALEKALRLARETLQTLHLHIVPPLVERRYGYYHNLGHMSFSDWPCLETLHVPFQMLLDRNRPDFPFWSMLPSSLLHLWLNDDGNDLWAYVRHHLSSDLQDQVGYQQLTPMLVDTKIVQLIKDFLNAIDTGSMPSLKSLKLFLYPTFHVDYRDISMVTNILQPLGQAHRLDLAVYKLPCRNAYRRWKWAQPCTQVPPYFELATVKRMCLPADYEERYLEDIDHKKDVCVCRGA